MSAILRAPLRRTAPACRLSGTARRPPPPRCSVERGARRVRGDGSASSRVVPADPSGGASRSRGRSCAGRAPSCGRTRAPARRRHRAVSPARRPRRRAAMPRCAERLRDRATTLTLAARAGVQQLLGEDRVVDPPSAREVVRPSPRRRHASMPRCARNVRASRSDSALRRSRRVSELLGVVGRGRSRRQSSSSRPPVRRRIVGVVDRSDSSGIAHRTGSSTRSRPGQVGDGGEPRLASLSDDAPVTFESGSSGRATLCELVGVAQRHARLDDLQTGRCRASP